MMTSFRVFESLLEVLKFGKERILELVLFFGSDVDEAEVGKGGVGHLEVFVILLCGLLQRVVHVVGVEDGEMTLGPVAVRVVGTGVDVVVVEELGDEVRADVHGERGTGFAAFKQFGVVANLKKNYNSLYKFKLEKSWCHIYLTDRIKFVHMLIQTGKVHTQFNFG